MNSTDRAPNVCSQVNNLHEFGWGGEKLTGPSGYIGAENGDIMGFLQFLRFFSLKN